MGLHSTKEEKLIQINVVDKPNSLTTKVAWKLQKNNRPNFISKMALMDSEQKPPSGYMAKKLVIMCGNLYTVIIIVAAIPAHHSAAYVHKLHGPSIHLLHLPTFQHGYQVLQGAKLNFYTHKRCFDQLKNQGRAMYIEPNSQIPNVLQFCMKFQFDS